MENVGSVKRRVIILIALLVCTGCSPSRSTEPTRTIKIQQSWQMQIGDTIGNHRIAAGLGDISIELNGDSAYAPFAGRLQPNIAGCVLFSSPEVPAYLFRLCGLNQPRLGEIRPGEAIGAGSYLHFATLRKQPDGTWTMVEPAKDVLERILQKP